MAMGEEAQTKQDTVQARISRRMVQLQKEFYGRGPTKAKTYAHDDLVTVLMRGGFNRVEQTLLDEGRGDSVVQQRADFQEVMLERYSQIIEEETGRKVAAFMSGSHQEPDLLAEIFILSPTDMTSDEKAEEGPAAE